MVPPPRRPPRHPPLSHTYIHSYIGIDIDIDIDIAITYTVARLRGTTIHPLGSGIASGTTSFTSWLSAFRQSSCESATTLLSSHPTLSQLSFSLLYNNSLHTHLLRTPPLSLPPPPPPPLGHGHGHSSVPHRRRTGAPAPFTRPPPTTHHPPRPTSHTRARRRRRARDEAKRNGTAHRSAPVCPRWFSLLGYTAFDRITQHSSLLEGHSASPVKPGTAG